MVEFQMRKLITRVQFTLVLLPMRKSIRYYHLEEDKKRNQEQILNHLIDK